MVNRPLFAWVHSSLPVKFSVACLLVSGGVLIASAVEEPDLAAYARPNRNDMDGDGLRDVQELVFGSSPSRADTDSDGYSDAEEIARGSDPRNTYSIPDDRPFSVGLCVGQEDGVTRVLALTYVREDKIGSTRLQVGFVHDGMIFRVLPRNYQLACGFMRPGKEPGDRICGLEFGVLVPQIRRAGQMDFFASMRDTTPGVLDPFRVATLTVVDFSGTLVQARVTGDLPRMSSANQGVIYRPIVPSNRVPSTWSGGLACLRRAAVVGVSGASLIHEIEGADCVSMDTFCSPGDCAAGVGKNMALPDPAALAGG